MRMISVVLLFLAGLLLAGCPQQPPPPHSFTTSLSPISLTVAQGGAGNTTLTVTPEHGFTGVVTVELLNAPTGVSLAVSSMNVTGTAPINQTLTISVDSGVPAQTYNLQVRAVSGGITRVAGLALTVTVPTVIGTLSNTRGGPAVSGATVVVEGAGLTTTTRADGSFAFTVPDGTYNLVATRPGYGASRLQGVGVSSPANTRVEMLMRDRFSPDRPASAPIISVTGLTPGQTVSGTVSFTITVTADNPMFSIAVRYGHRGDIANASFSDTPTASVSWNTATRANGPTFINIIAYDNNHNVAEWNFPVTVSNTGGAVPATPAAVWATAVTFGQTLGTFRAQRVEAAAGGRLGDPHLLPLRDGRSIDIQAAPADASLFVYVMWAPVTGATGYRVYRSFSDTGPFTLLADAGPGASAACTALAFGGMTQCHRDSSPELAAGRAVYYRVSAYTTAGVSAPSGTASTTPLEVFNLNLSTPADEATTIAPGSTPTFSWAPVATVGTFRFFQGYVVGVNAPWATRWNFCVTTTSATYGTPGETCAGSASATPLQRSKRYEWDVLYAFAAQAYATGDAYSMAGSRAFGTFPFVSSGSLNGPFRFTTTP